MPVISAVLVAIANLGQSRLKLESCRTTYSKSARDGSRWVRLSDNGGDMLSRRCGVTFSVLCDRPRKHATESRFFVTAGKFKPRFDWKWEAEAQVFALPTFFHRPEERNLRFRLKGKAPGFR